MKVYIAILPVFSIGTITATALDEISEENCTSIPEILEALVDAIKDGDINIADYV